MKRKNIVVIESETAPDDKYAIWKNGNEVKQVIGDEWTHCADLSEYSDVDGMKYGASNITKFPDNWRFAPRTKNNCSSMFSNCSLLKSLDLSFFDISKVTGIQGMLRDCSSLTSLNLSSFDTSNVTNMTSVFYSCDSLRSLDLSSFDTSKVIYMLGMFERCRLLTSLDLSSFDTGNVTNIANMFYYCDSLESLDFSNSDMSKVTDSYKIFYKCSKLQTITKGSFKNLKVSLDLSPCVVLSKQSVVDLFDSIGTANSGAKITLTSAVYSQLSEDEIKVATDKGWTVASL